MKTLKTSRRFSGTPIRFRVLCQWESRSLPFSVRDFVDTGGIRDFNGHLTSGDVGCTWKMHVEQSGSWSVNGNFHDGGILAGDFFFAEFLLDATQPVGVRLEGSLLDLVDTRYLSLQKHGFDPWIRLNWDKVEHSGPTVRLHAAPALAILLEDLAFPLLALGESSSKNDGPSTSPAPAATEEEGPPEEEGSP
jgi:hypothetical protein